MKKQGMSIYSNTQQEVFKVATATGQLDLSGNIHVRGNITCPDEDKEIFKGITSKKITIGGDNVAGSTKSTIIMGGDLQTNYNIICDDEDENKELWTSTDVNITIGSDDSTVIVGNDLKVNNNIIADADEHKEIFKNVISKDITIGGDDAANSKKSKIIIGGELTDKLQYYMR